jgi:hypothetical protein
MATIGTFTKQQNGGFAGTINTLTVKAKVTFAPVEKTSDNAPDFRVYAGGRRRSARRGPCTPRRAMITCPSWWTILPSRRRSPVA